MLYKLFATFFKPDRNAFLCLYSRVATIYCVEDVRLSNIYSIAMLFFSAAHLYLSFGSQLYSIKLSESTQAKRSTLTRNWGGIVAHPVMQMHGSLKMEENLEVGSQPKKATHSLQWVCQGEDFPPHVKWGVVILIPGRPNCRWAWNSSGMNIHDFTAQPRKPKLANGVLGQ